MSDGDGAAPENEIRVAPERAERSAGERGKAGDGEGRSGPDGPDEEDDRGDAGARPPRLVLQASARDELARELEAAYPEEGCGVLLGEIEGPDRRVTEVRPAENRWPEADDRGGRYLVDPGTLRRLMDREIEGGPAILGFYHSHPDSDAVPSETDREMAWPWYLYLVVPVRDGTAGEGRAWELDEDAGELRERPVVRPDRGLGPTPGG